MQDRRGPRICAFLGTVFVSVGFFLTSLTTSLTFLYVAFGIIVGAGNGFGYATPMPVASKWFPDKRGLVVGIMVGGYGAASFLLSLFVPNMIASIGWRHDVPDPRGHLPRDGPRSAPGCMHNPPAGLPTRRLDAACGRGVAPRFHHRRDASDAAVLSAVGGVLPRHDGRPDDHQPARALRPQRGIAAATALLVGACGNAGGRILSGWLSDAVGRLTTLRIMVLASAVAMPALFVFREQLSLFFILRRGRLLVLRHTAVGVCDHDRRPVRHEEPGAELRRALHRMGRGGHPRTDHRRTGLRRDQELSDTRSMPPPCSPLIAFASLLMAKPTVSAPEPVASMGGAQLKRA